MPRRLAGKIALITGGSAGMALATAEMFVDEGAVVYLIGRGQQALDQAVDRLGPRARGIVADAADLADIDRLFATIRAESGRLDVLFTSAALGNTDPLTHVTPETFDQVFGLNVRGTLFTAQKAVALMTGGGSIILNGSALVDVARPDTSVYTASKAALLSFARVWSAELAGRGIRVNVLHPGPIDTAALAGLSEQAREHRASLSMTGRLGLPREIAAAVLFLASEDSSYVTATELFVSGGMELEHSPHYGADLD